jgi:hypothetical protein
LGRCFLRPWRVILTAAGCRSAVAEFAGLPRLVRA